MNRTRAGCRVVMYMLLLTSVAAAALTENEKTAVEQLNAMSPGQFQNLKVLANRGQPGAQTLLGIAYMRGVRVAKDDVAAFRLFSAAGKKKQAIALNNLGMLYFYGVGVEKNYAEAVKCFRGASAQGHSNAQFNLATMYHHGYGVKQDLNEAAKWYEIAAVQGEPAAQNVIATFYETGTGVVKDQAQALKWYTKAAEKGYAIAQYNLGNMQLDAKNHQGAMEWFLRAAKQGHAGAIRNVAELYLHGHCMKVDYHEAYLWLASSTLKDEWTAKTREECRKHLTEQDVQDIDTRVTANLQATR